MQSPSSSKKSVLLFTLVHRVWARRMGLGNVPVPGADPSAFLGNNCGWGWPFVSHPARSWTGSTETVDESLCVPLVVGPPEAEL